MPSGDIGRAPEAELRVRRAIEKMSDIWNDLMRAGLVTRGTDGKWTITATGGGVVPPPVIIRRVGERGKRGAPGSQGATGATGATGPAGSGGSGGVLTPPGKRHVVKRVTRPPGGVGVLNPPGTASVFLDGTGKWSSPAGGSGGSTTEQYVRRAPFYPPFTPSGDDDEFDDNSFTGWTLVEDASPNITITESHDICSILHPGGDATAELHALLKARTISANDWVEVCFSAFGFDTSGFVVFGAMMSDGATYGAGNQVIFYHSSSEQMQLRGFTNFSTAGTVSSYPFTPSPAYSTFIFRLMYLGSNTWRGYLSIDGVSYINVTGDLARTMTPTHAGFFVSTWAAAVPSVFVVRYCRFGSGTP